MAYGKRKLSTTGTSLRILELIADNGGATLRELTEETGLAKSTVHKHLSTLLTNEYLVKQGEQYTLSLHHLTLGKRAVEIREEYRFVEQKIRELRSQTDAEIDFTVEDYGRLIMVMEDTGTSSESAFGQGTKFYLHNTAAGKAILATYPEEKVDEILDEQGMPKTTANTIQSRKKLKSELENVREKGYAINDGECIEGYRTVSSVIMNPNETTLGAISIGGPIYKIDRSRLENELADRVCRATSDVSKTLSETSGIHR